MTSRRERPPSGRVANHSNNFPEKSYGGSETSNSNMFQSQNLSGSARYRDLSGRRPKTAGAASARSSHRSTESNVSTNELLRRMREKNDREKNSRMAAEFDALGEYNSYSRPKSSNVSGYSNARPDSYSLCSSVIYVLLFNRCRLFLFVLFFWTLPRITFPALARVRS